MTAFLRWKVCFCQGPGIPASKGLNLDGVPAILIFAAGSDGCGSALAAAGVFSLHTTYRLFLSNVEMVQLVLNMSSVARLNMLSALSHAFSFSCEKSTDIYIAPYLAPYMAGYLGVIVENKGPDSLTDQDRWIHKMHRFEAFMDPSLNTIHIAQKRGISSLS